jgi:hypothetical protein
MYAPDTERPSEDLATDAIGEWDAALADRDLQPQQEREHVGVLGVRDRVQDLGRVIEQVPEVQRTALLA